MPRGSVIICWQRVMWMLTACLLYLLCSLCSLATDTAGGDFTSLAPASCAVVHTLISPLVPGALRLHSADCCFSWAPAALPGYRERTEGLRALTADWWQAVAIKNLLLSLHLRNSCLWISISIWIVIKVISPFALIRPRNTATSNKSVFLQLQKEY